MVMATAKETREQKGRRLFESGAVTPIGEKLYSVAGDSGNSYRVDTDGMPSCNCVDCRVGGNYCKHLVAVTLAEADGVTAVPVADDDELDELPF